MWVKIRGRELLVILHYVGLLMVGVGLSMSVPLVAAVVSREWGPALDYLVGIGTACALGLALALVRPQGGPLNHAHALVIAGASWLVASAVAAVPLALSGSYVTYLDAMFDTVSGFTTSGLTVVRDLDHMSLAHNLWRHMTHLIGGQGIIVAAISLAVGVRGGAFSLYLAEGRDERIEPNVMNTARVIWMVTAVYVTIGTAAVAGVLLDLGMGPWRALVHGAFAAFACFDTGGFGPQSQNALYYHSWGFELVTMLLMIAGTMNFNLHAVVWRGQRTELLKNLEVRVLALNLAVLGALAAVGLAATTTYRGATEVFRKGIYHLVSAHTGTGHQTLYAEQWTSVYSGVALVAVLLAMAAGGSMSSTAGGIKALRIGVFIKNTLLQVRRQLAPQSASLTSHYEHLKRRRLTHQAAAGAMLLIILYAVTYVTGAIVGVAHGYPPTEALFESISATANVGLSTGITGYEMPVGLKLTYMLQMWLGRLEFLAAFTLIAAVVLALVPSRRVKRAG